VKRFLAFVAVLATLFVIVEGAPGRAPADVTSPERCNAIVATQLGDQVRGFDKHPPAPDALDERFAQLQRVLSGVGQEEGILESTCSSDSAGAVVDAQLQAVAAWALALESDIVRQKFAKSCPAAETPVAAGFVAAGWRELAKGAPDQGTVPPSIGEVEPKVQSRAAAVGLTLPSLADASNYWASQVQAKGKEAVVACPQ
jgi:hypothetical protein